MKITSAKVTDNRIGSGSGDSPADDYEGFKKPNNDGLIGGGSSNSEIDGL